MLKIEIYFVCLILGFIFSFLLRKKINIKGLALELFFSVLTLIGGILIWQSSNLIEEAMIRRTWPLTTAIVTETATEGNRAIHPELAYTYKINGVIYSQKTDLATPGFGQRNSRRDTAERINSMYPNGSEVRIHYNPENPLESCIRPGPYWSDYLRAGLGIIALVIGLTVYIEKIY